MIPFFRKIRKKLADDNQFLKYSRYAIGEIVLVVIGILIALSINNWNELRKEQEKFDFALVEVENELIKNIVEARHVLDFYHYKDSLINIFFFDTLTLEDYKRNPNFMRLPNNSNKFDIHDDAYQKLLGLNDDVLARQGSIIKNLKQIYSGTKISIESTDEQMFLFTIEATRYKESYSWYKDHLLGRYTDEMYEFYLNDPMYKNQVSTWVIFGLGNQTSEIEYFDIMARRVYRDIHNYLGNIIDEHNDTLMFEYDPVKYSHYVGTYVPNWYSDGSDIDIDSIVVCKENNKLFLSFYPTDGIIDKEEITPVNKHYFRTQHRYGFWSNVFDDKGNVVGLNFSSGLFMIKNKKIR